MMNMFKNILGNLGDDKAGDDGNSNADAQINDLFKQFTSVLGQGEGEGGDSEFKKALESAF